MQECFVRSCLHISHLNNLGTSANELWLIKQVKLQIFSVSSVVRQWSRQVVLGLPISKDSWGVDPSGNCRKQCTPAVAMFLPAPAALLSLDKKISNSKSPGQSRDQVYGRPLHSRAQAPLQYIHQSNDASNSSHPPPHVWRALQGKCCVCLDTG